MLKVTIHAGTLSEASAQNTVANLDIAYRKPGPVADYVAALSVRGVGQHRLAEVTEYPRWAGSLWTLVARSIAVCLYRTPAVPAVKTDKRRAYVRALCALVMKENAKGVQTQLATGEIRALAKRCHYEATFTEDILSDRSAQFVFGPSKINYADLTLRAICHAYYGQAVLGPVPALIVPPSFSTDGKTPLFHIEALTEPARTGFTRHCGGKVPAVCKLADYAQFLAQD